MGLNEGDGDLRGFGVGLVGKKRVYRNEYDIVERVTEEDYRTQIYFGWTF